MSGLSYEAMLHGIRTMPFSGAGIGDPPPPPPSSAGATLDQIFEEGAGTPEEPREPPPPLFDLPLARAASGWGAIGGLVLGIALGARDGAISLIISIAVGISLGSLVGIGCLVLFAGSVARFGPAWALILTALGVGLSVAMLGF